MSAPRYQAPRGTHDVLPQEAARWQWAEDAFRDTCRRAGFGEIRTPTFEDTEVFARGVGDTTDIVTKQMYTFEDRGGRSVTLCAEGTAPVIRALIQHGALGASGVQKVFYLTPIFRYERPQAGRLREHHQAGLEVVGAAGPEADAEVIAVGMSYLAAVGITDAALRLNSIGDAVCRAAYRDRLRDFLRPQFEELCPDCQVRFERNPLRIFDCKVPRCRGLIAGAPAMVDHLCADCRAHFDGVQAALRARGIVFTLDPNVVRGLDYYTRTAFEVTHGALGAQDALLGGGRYDGLAEILGGPPTPGVGFGSGIERVLFVTGKLGTGPPASALDAYVAAASDGAAVHAGPLADRLRSEGLTTDFDPLGRSLKAQMKEAARRNAAFAIILGDDELAAGEATLRDLTTGHQERVAVDRLAVTLKQWRKSPPQPA